MARRNRGWKTNPYTHGRPRHHYKWYMERCQILDLKYGLPAPVLRLEALDILEAPLGEAVDLDVGGTGLMF